MPAAMYLPAFTVHQKLSMTTNRYQLWETRPDGSQGAMVGLAQQKRMALKERVTFYADEQRSRLVFSFAARQVVDLGAGYDVADGAGSPLGFFRKEFGASLLRTTFRAEGEGWSGTGEERSQAVALVRRFTDLPFLPVHFDFVADDGAPLLSVERQASVRDRYAVRVVDERVDFRVAASLAVGLDALLGR